MVEHRNVVNFFAGMDERVPHAPRERLARGHEPLVRHLGARAVLDAGARLPRRAPRRRAQGGGAAPPGARATPRQPIDFSLFYFASDEGEHAADKYRLLLDGARFADAHGFAAVWTPERHFHAFGGLYPEPVGDQRGDRRRSRSASRSAPAAASCRCTTRSASPRSGRSSTTSRTAASASRSRPAGSPTTSCCAPRTSRAARSR